MKKFLVASVFLLLLSCTSKNKTSEKVNEPSLPEYQLVENWPSLPSNFLLGDAVGLDIDSENNLFVFHRGPRRMTSLNVAEDFPIIEETILKIDTRNGELLDSWGDSLFMMPHGLMVDSDDNVWVTDVGLHQVFKFSNTGELLMILGEAGIHGDDSLHFYLPTDVATSQDGFIYVSDGYGNSRVVKFSKDGKYQYEWGTKGDENGQFVIPHGIDIGESGNVYVADRENNRIQVFDANGSHLNTWQNRESDQLYSVTVDEKSGYIFGIDYLVKDSDVIGSDIIQLDMETNLIQRVGRSGSYQGQLMRYHDISIDRLGNIYVGDIYQDKIQKFELIHR
jgi:DNA-binding beta-propeller fold protein YncE